MANKEPKVKVQNLTKRFGDLLVLDNLNFEVEEGEFLCIVGPTGCGKTTFLNSLTRLYEPTAGDILVNGIPVNPHIRKQCRRVIDGHRLKGLVAYVFFCNHIY